MSILIEKGNILFMIIVLMFQELLKVFLSSVYFLLLRILFFFIGLENFKIAKIHFFKTYGFSDQYTSDLFHAQFKNLCDRNRGRDAHMDSYIHINIDGYKPYVMALLDLSQKPWYIQKWIYIVSALLGLSFFYRWVIDR